MPRTLETFQKIRDTRREQIVKAALRVFARKGYAATKITDIAAAAEISHGLVNYYFASKEDLYGAIVEDTLEGALRGASEALERSGSAWERLVWLCQNMLDGIRETPEYGLVMAQVGITERLPAQIKAFYDDYSTLIQQKFTLLIEQGQQEGAVTAGDPIQLALLLTATISGLSLSAIIPHGSINPIPTNPHIVLRMLKV